MSFNIDEYVKTKDGVFVGRVCSYDGDYTIIDRRKKIGVNYIHVFDKIKTDTLELMTTDDFELIDKNSVIVRQKLFRFHSGKTVYESVAESYKVETLIGLTNIIRAAGFIKVGEEDLVTAEFYCYDNRINWVTFLVTVRGCAVGYLNTPIERLEK